MAVIYEKKKKTGSPICGSIFKKWVWPPIKSYIDNKLKAN